MNKAQMAAAILAAWNVIVFFIYGLDKWNAKRGRRRISERALLLMAFLMGAPGALAGMILFRHKTRYAKFYVGVPLLVILNLLICGAIIVVFYLGKIYSFSYFK